MNYKEYINSKANDYKRYLLDDLSTNTEILNIVDSVFFPLGRSIQNWLEETEVKSFYEYQFRGDRFINRICTREEIDSIPYWNGISDDFARYTFFSYLKCNSYDDVKKKIPTSYLFMQKDFHETIDKIILERLSEYKRKNGNTKFYTKGTSNDIELTICTDREYVESQGIVGYSFPSLLINTKDEGHINFGTIDVRSLLFLPSSSFLFFYADSHNYIIDEDLRIKNVTRKKDEPVVYYLEEEQKYMITNSWENIDRYNKYIKIILELSFHYFGVFEKWLTKLLREIPPDVRTSITVAK